VVSGLWSVARDPCGNAEKDEARGEEDEERTCVFRLVKSSRCFGIR